MNELVLFPEPKTVISNPAEILPAEIVAEIVEAEPEAIFFVDEFNENFARVIYKKNDTVCYSFIDGRTKKLAFNGMAYKFANHFKEGKAEITMFDGSEGTINVYGKVDITRTKKRKII